MQKLVMVLEGTPDLYWSYMHGWGPLDCADQFDDDGEMPNLVDDEAYWMDYDDAKNSQPSRG